MNESEFLRAAVGVLDRIEAAVDAVSEAGGIDIDIERKSEGVLALEFENGSHIIINLQAPMQQIWIAAKAGGYHFALLDGPDTDAAQWIDTRSGEEFFGVLSAHATLQSGTAVRLTA